MKQSSKERLATLLMDELLERLAGRDSLRKMFGEMASLPIDDVLEHLISEFERSVEQYRATHVPPPKHAGDKKSKETAEFTAPSVVPSSEAKHERKERAESPAASPVVQPSPAAPAKQDSINRDARDVAEREEKPLKAAVQIDPIKLEFPKIRLKIPDPPIQHKQPDPPPAAVSQTEPEKKAPVPTPKPDNDLRKLEELARKIEAEYEAKAKQRQFPTGPRREEPAGDEEENPVIPEPVSTEIEDDDELETVASASVGKQTTRAAFTFTDDEFVYLHAVGRIPDGKGQGSEAFMLEEKGINGHDFAFALDYSGMRFYLSKINPNEMNVSKAMVLLLNKQESLQLQGVHESVLNDLRGHGVLLPFEFGTVARGKDSFHDMVDKNLEDLEEELEDIEQTTWWTVTASVLDSTIAKIVGTDVQSFGRDRSRERASYTSAAQGKKFDVKVLERILQREKKLAESIHTDLSAAADRADVDIMVGLGSGSSEDWKVILKASYDVPKRDVGRFSRTVTDLQYRHLQYDLMLALRGNRDFFTLKRK